MPQTPQIPQLSQLRGQRVLITGASSGIGQAIACAFADAGAAVLINYFSDQDEADRMVNDIRHRGGEALAVQADVSTAEGCETLFAAAEQAFGGIDVLIGNAGIQRDAAFTDMSLDDWNKVIAVNLTGQFLCAQAAVRCFRRQQSNRRRASLAQGSLALESEQDSAPQPSTDSASQQAPGFAPGPALGKIIFINSVHQEIPWAGRVNYAASKGGLKLLMESMAQELAVEKIRVNAIAPGAIKTEINRKSWDDPQAQEKMRRLIPYDRIGDPGDIAKAALWLASDDSDYVVGTTLFVDGGMTLYPSFGDGA